MNEKTIDSLENELNIEHKDEYDWEVSPNEGMTLRKCIIILLIVMLPLAMFVGWRVYSEKKSIIRGTLRATGEPITCVCTVDKPWYQHIK